MEVLRRQIIGEVDLWEPKEPFRHPKHRIASSVDRILEIKGEKGKLVLTWLGKEHRMSGTGICEIKTGAYHDGRPKPEWVMQVHNQMICTDLDWGIIACMDQHFRLNLYPVRRDPALEEVMLKAYAEFWELIDTDGDYPPIEEHDNDNLVDITEMLPKANHDLAGMCTDYLRAAAEANQWEKTRKQLREGIIFILDSMQVDYAKMPGFIIKAKDDIGLGRTAFQLNTTKNADGTVEGDELKVTVAVFLEGLFNCRSRAPFRGKGIIGVDSQDRLVRGKRGTGREQQRRCCRE